MRAAIVAVAILALATSSGAAVQPGRVAYVHSGNLEVIDLPTGRHVTALQGTASRPVGWSGDGRLLSSGGRIVGGPLLPAARLQWAPTGATAAYQTSTGSVEVWSPLGGRRPVVPASWGATSLAWGPGGRIALGRSVCTLACTQPRHQEVWVWRAGKLRRAAGPLRGISLPLAAGVDARGRALWWLDPHNSASLAADGLVLRADGRPLARTLVYPDFVVPCGTRIALAAGGGRYATQGKRIVLDGRDVSRDRSRSWVSPSCSADGSRLVAAAGRNWQEPAFGLEHRAIWQLLPTRRQLTRPPARWTDEAPHLLRDGSIQFVRSRLVNGGRGAEWTVTTHARISRLVAGKVRTLARVTYAASRSDPTGLVNYYGHYGWPDLIAPSR